MDIADNLSIDASSILMNLSTNDDFFNSIPNGTIDEDFEELMRTIESSNDFGENDLLALTENDNPNDNLNDNLMLTNDRHAFAMSGQTYDPMDYLKSDDGQFVNGNLSGNQQIVSNVGLQSQEVLVTNNMSPIMQLNEVGI